MAEHSQLVAEMGYVERLPLPERLRHAKKRRMQQLKMYTQREKQLAKSTNVTCKKTGNKRGSNEVASCDVDHLLVKKSGKRLLFADSVLLLDAVARNDTEEVKRLFASGISPNVCGSYGFTPLHQCCVSDATVMIRILLDAGADVNSRDFEHWTPLHAAAACGRIALCKCLCEHGADLLAINANGNMPYDLCEDVTTLDFIENEMTRQGITQETIDEARLSTETSMLEDLNQLSNSDLLEYRGNSGETLLHVAACSGFTRAMQFLIDHGVSINATDKDSWQPIHCAAFWAQVAAVELLLVNGVAPDVKTTDGQTIIDLCEDLEVRQRLVEIVEELASKRLSKSVDRAPSSRASTKSNRRGGSVRRSSNAGALSSSWQRRSSIHEKKDAIAWREMKEEAERLHEAILQSSKDEDEDRPNHFAKNEHREKLSVLMSSSMESEPCSPPPKAAADSSHMVASDSAKEQCPTTVDTGVDISSVVPDLLLKSPPSSAVNFTTSEAANKSSSSQDGHRHSSGKSCTAGSIDSKSKASLGRLDKPGHAKTTTEAPKVYHHTGVFRKTPSGNYTDLEVDHKSSVSGSGSQLGNCCCVIL